MPNEASLTSTATPAACRAGVSRVSAFGTDEVILRAVDVSRDFGGVQAVAWASIEVRRGTLTGLIGPNGAGRRPCSPCSPGRSR